MSGIYLHIPFCKQACHYCNFHFSTSLKLKAPLIEAILKELELQKEYLPSKKLETIYLGGGTPSLLSGTDLDRIFSTINRLFDVEQEAEITLEANPDDLKDEKIKQLQDSPVNRLSIGIQSFFDEDLQFMNRAHHAKEALSCIEKVRKAGFKDLTIDLIYGAPTTTDEHWEANVQQAIALEVPHLSCYALTVEPQTALAHFVKAGKVPDVEDEKVSRQFNYLMEAMEKAGYVHYEISNFSLPGRYSRHNSSYWKNKPYLGIGPSAHSYNGHTRQWNIANNAKYIKAIQTNTLPFEIEQLTPAQRYNEYVMTSLRTIWGCDLKEIAKLGDKWEQYFLKHVQPYLRKGYVVLKNGTNVQLSQQGKLLADRITADLFWID